MYRTLTIMRLGLLPAVSSWLGVLPLLLLPTATSAVEVLCRHPTDDCGLAAGLCGSVGASVERDELVTVCVGFQGPAGAAAGKKALFQVKVDHYASLTIDSCAPVPRRVATALLAHPANCCARHALVAARFRASQRPFRSVRSRGGCRGV